MKWFFLVLSLLCLSGCIDPSGVTNTPGPGPAPNVITVPADPALVAAFRGDREVAAAVADLAEQYADCLARDQAVIKSTAQIRAAWSASGRIQIQGTPIFKRVPGLGEAVDKILFDRLGKTPQPLDAITRGKAVEAFRLISSSARGV